MQKRIHKISLGMGLGDIDHSKTKQASAYVLSLFSPYISNLTMLKWFLKVNECKTHSWACFQIERKNKLCVSDNDRGYQHRFSVNHWQKIEYRLTHISQQKRTKFREPFQ